MNRKEGDFISYLNVQGRVHRTTLNPFMKTASMNKNSYIGTQKDSSELLWNMLNNEIIPREFFLSKSIYSHLELSFCKSKSCHVLKLID